jgi:UDP-3-O-[3-hydroxymyristoyl] N-acetylglucosamine deacetylase
LHNGLNVNVTLKSAKPNEGIVFKRVDLKNNNLIYPNFLNVTNTSLNTTIENEHGVKVSTIEHLMGALFGLGIDNVLIEIDNEEVPILDGSAKNFIEKIISSGFEISEEPIKIIKINKKIEYSDGKRFISIEPSKLSLDIDFELRFKNEIIGNQRNKVKVYEDDLTDVYNSRTFCLFEDIEFIKKNGLAKGGSLDNAIVVKDKEILNKDGLRNDKEFVNHKILDCIGDLYTSGYRIIGNVQCSQGGHYLTNQLLRKVFVDKNNFSIIEIREKNLPHTLINRNLLRSIA